MRSEVEKCDRCDAIWDELVDISMHLYIAPDNPHSDIPALKASLKEVTDRLTKAGCSHSVPTIGFGRRLPDTPLFRTDKVLKKLEEELQPLSEYLARPDKLKSFRVGNFNPPGDEQK